MVLRPPLRCRSRGTTIAEVPVGIYLLFFGIAIPLMILASVFIRVFLLYSTAQNSCTAAARSITFTDARTRAATEFNRNIQSWPGLTGTHVFTIQIRNLASGTTTVATAPLPRGSIRATENVYLARVVVTGQVEPLLRMEGIWPFNQYPIPGITAPYPLTTAYVSYFESPNGLTN